MARSRKARNGTALKRTKDTVLGSRSQKRAWTKRKRKAARQERLRCWGCGGTAGVRSLPAGPRIYVDLPGNWCLRCQP